MWSNLVGTNVWNEARAAYQSPAGRHYHNFDHVLRLYEIADDKQLPHDPALDLAILAHDVIYDDAPDKELRSAEWLLDRSNLLGPDIAGKAADLVMTTARHKPGADDRLVLLDLHDFRDLERSLENRELLVCEFRDLVGVERDGFIAGNTKFLKAMAADIERGLDQALKADRDDWQAIVAGIKALLSHEPQPHPMNA